LSQLSFSDWARLSADFAFLQLPYYFAVNLLL